MVVAEIARWPGRLVTGVFIAAIKLYQFTLSPLIGPACRFEPTCSRYMIESLRKYGLIRGIAKGVGRVCRCHPLHPGGYDPP